MRKYAGPIVSVVTFVVCLAIAELALGLLAPVADPYEHLKVERPEEKRYIPSEFPRNISVATEAEEGLPGVQGENRFSTNNMGFRGDDLVVPKPPNEFRVFMIGGSTTECFYLDDSEAVSRVLQGELNGRLPHGRVVRVYNAGKSGDASDDHVSMMVHRIAHLQPDLIVVFSGINDLRRAIANYDYLHYASAVPGRSLPLLRMMATERQIPRRLHHLLRRTLGSREALEKETLERIPLKSEQYAKIAVRKAAPVSSATPRTDLSGYGGNLRTLIGVAKAHGSRLVLMTQQTTWNSRIDRTAVEWHWMRFARGVTYREDLMDEALESMNAVMRVLAEEHGVPLYDLARVMPKSSQYFYDDVHFNVEGAARAGKELAAIILDEVLGLHDSGSSPTADPAG